MKYLLTALALVFLSIYAPFNYYGISGSALATAEKAYFRLLKDGKVKKQILMVIDFTKPSTEKRLMIKDMKTGEVLLVTYVAHGKNSGTLYPTAFSNKVGSLKTSIGVYTTLNEYTGSLGRSLNVQGLEAGINNNAFKRRILVHGAWYVSKEIAAKYGQMGRSEGCFAIPQYEIDYVINLMKDGAVIVAYYPDPTWLKTSTYLVNT